MRQIPYFIFAAFIIVCDQLSKWAVTEHIIRRAVEGGKAVPAGFIDWLSVAPFRLPFTQVEVLPVFNWAMVWNQGVSFGMFNKTTDYGPMFLVILSFVITVFFAVWLLRGPAMAQCLGIALVIGGALGNVIDRLRFGAVIDFLDFHIAGYHYPAFNIADSGIVIGVGVLIIYSLFFEKRLLQRP